MTSLSPTARGIAYMIGGITVFTLMDALAKHLILQGYSPLQVVWARYTGQTVLIVALLAPRLPGALRSRHPALQALRSLFQFGASGLFFLSLRYIGLAEATAIADTSPVLITLGAALFLGERIGPRRLAGVIVALIGALIVIRPGGELFTPASFLPMAGALCYTGFALVSRRIGGADSAWTSLLYAALVGTVVTSAIVPAVWTPIALRDLWGFVLIGGIGALAQLGLFRAFTLAEAGTVAPFGYVGIPLATLWGFTFFGTVPDRMTILGALVIIGAGLYVWHRETRAPLAPQSDQETT
ncbi:MAG: DMT family transporter [Paracoccaceae bacterium]